MVRHFERLGGTMRARRSGGRRSTRIGNRATEVEDAKRLARARSTRSPATPTSCTPTATCSAASSAARQMAQVAGARSASRPSLFVVHFGIEGSWPGIPHHMILFGPRYKGLLEDIYEHGVLPAGFLDLPAPPDGDRSEHGAAGQEHILRAGAGRPHGQAADRLGRGRARCSKSASSTRSGAG